MARKKTQGVDVGVDQLVNDLSLMLEKDGKTTSVDLTDVDGEYIVEDLDNYVSSQSSLLDLAVSNRPGAGIITYGRILEINGLEGSGKSLICAHMIVDVQQSDGIAVWIDTEFALDDNNKAFFKAVGVDFNRLIVVNSICLEDVFDTLENIINKVRSTNKDKKVLLIVDSLTALKPRSELERDMSQGKDGYGTAKPKFLSDTLSRIQSLIKTQRIALVFTQQLRQKFGAMPFADQWTTSGGRALPFYASVRLRLSQTNQIKLPVGDDKIVVGCTVEAKVIKNRLGPPHRKVKFDIYFDRGIDDVSSWIDVLKKRGIIDGAKGNYTYVDNSGKEHKFKTGSWKKFTEEHPDTFEEIYTKLADAMIMKYSTEGVSTIDGSAEIDTDIED
jgi:recombination protein RecA